MVAEETEDRVSYTEVTLRSRADITRRMQALADGFEEVAQKIESGWPPPPSEPAPPYLEPPSTPPPSERH